MTTQPAEPLPLSLPGLHVHVAGHGPPVLLVHSINAAAGAHEMRPLAEHLRETHTVYTPDLPGFGASARADVAYTPRLYTDALHAVVQAIQARQGTAALPAVALSLGCEFLARAAAERPAAFSRLALVSPTGLMGTKARRGPPGATRAVPGLHALVAAPWWGERLFRQLTRPAVVRYFLRRTWGSDGIDETMWAEAVAAARAPGAHHAPLHFLSAGLFSADVLALYEALAMPVWASHGTRGDFTDYRGRVHLQHRPNWHWTVYEGGALPFFEHRAAFAAALDRFLAGDSRPA
ncbi:MAG: alpha/beta fold hydrolase [Betaproteobacteria bacterium]|jgi:pimeloyl-ACP methyl ester carboxylesterase